MGNVLIAALSLISAYLLFPIIKDSSFFKGASVMNNPQPPQARRYKWQAASDFTLPPPTVDLAATDKPEYQ